MSLSTAQDRKPQGGGPSAWGAASLLSAVDEGLAGIVDAGVMYDAIRFSPRWPVTDYTQVRYFTGYEVSGAVVDCQYVLRANGLRYLLRSPARRVASTCGTASTANARIATRRAVPMIIASPNAGQTMNAAPMRTAARASAMIRRWYSR